MDRERIKPLIGSKLPFDKNLPSLKTSTLMAKTIISLSKVDIDARNINRRNGRTSSMLEKEGRSQSGLTLRKFREDKEYKNMTRGHFQGIPGSAKHLLRDIKEDEPPPNSFVSIDKAKISSKGYGLVKAYSANSHPGPHLSYNQDRICIVTNLTKTNIRQRQISFFGVYDGNEGVAKADYMRDNFHVCLAEDQAFPKDLEFAMRRTLRRISSAFTEDQRHFGDQSVVSFVIVVIFNEQIHYFQCGSCRAVFSCALGERLFHPPSQNQSIKQTVRKARSVGELAKRNRWRELSQVEYRRFKEGDQVDCVILGSEGVYQNFKPVDLGRKFWLYLLKNKLQNIHYSIGQVNNLILADIFNNQGSKNTSLIIIALKHVLECFDGGQAREQMLVPCCSGEVCLTQFNQ